jgi:microcystin-dependent protein
MPSLKISQLPQAASVTPDDLVAVVDDPAGTPTTRKATAAALMALAWPVGSIFLSAVATNPSVLLGFGTWAAVGAGRVLVGIDAAQTEFDALLKTGGEKTHALVTGEVPAHNHPVTDPGHTHLQNAHNHLQDPHAHVQSVNSGTTGALSGYTPDTSTSTSATSGYSTANATATNQPATAVNQGATTGVTVGNAGGGAAHNNLQPFLVVSMWQRTA